MESFLFATLGQFVAKIAMKLEIFQVDAFTSVPFGGNPAAVVPLTEWLPDETMFKIAAENNLAETAFFVKEDGNYHIRWFTPAVEVNLCGHATLASSHVIFNELKLEEEFIPFHSDRSGSLGVNKVGDKLILDFPAYPMTEIEQSDELASFIGQLIQTYKGALSSVAGVVIILFGMHFLGWLKIPLLYTHVRVETDMRGASLAGAYVIGLAFAFGWTPCVGPVLATVLAVAANENSLKTGVALLFLYSLGLGIPFVLAAMAVKPFLAMFKSFRSQLGRVEKVMGAALIVTGVLFLTGSIGIAGQWLIENVPALARLEDWVTPKGLGGAIMKKGAG